MHSVHGCCPPSSSHPPPFVYLLLPPQYHIWDTVNTDLAQDEDYSPTYTGYYKWPLVGATGYYKTLYSGPLPPDECYFRRSIPAGTEYTGCYENPTGSPLFGHKVGERKVQGPHGMTIQVKPTLWI